MCIDLEFFFSSQSVQNNTCCIVVRSFLLLISAFSTGLCNHFLFHFLSYYIINLGRSNVSKPEILWASNIITWDGYNAQKWMWTSGKCSVHLWHLWHLWKDTEMPRDTKVIKIWCLWDMMSLITKIHSWPKTASVFERHGTCKKGDLRGRILVKRKKDPSLRGPSLLRQSRPFIV